MNPAKTYSRTPLDVTIIMVFLIGLLFNMGMSDYLIDPKVKPEEFTSVLTKIASIYSVNFGIILAGYFASSNSPETSKISSRDVVAGIVIVTLSLAWNFMIGITVIHFGHSKDMSYDHFVQRLDSVNAAIDFLVAGGLAYFFGRKAILAGEIQS